MQAYWTFFVMFLYTALLCVAYQWLHPYAHYLDVCYTTPLLFFCAMASWFCDGRQLRAQEL